MASAIDKIKKSPRAGKSVNVPFDANAFIRNTEKLRLQLIKSPKQDDIVEINAFICRMQDRVRSAAERQGVRITAKISEESPEDYV